MTVKKTTLKQAVKAAIRNNTKLIPMHGFETINIRKMYGSSSGHIYGTSKVPGACVWLTIEIKCRQRKKKKQCPVKIKM